MNVLIMRIRNEGGGLFVRIDELISEIAKRGWKVHLISPKDFRYANCENIIQHRIFYFPLVGRYIPYILQTFFVMLWLLTSRKHKIDVVVAFTALNGFICACVKVFNRNTKLCLSLRNDDMAGIDVTYKNRLFKMVCSKIFQFMEKLALQKTDLIIFVSNDLRKQVLKRTNYRYIEKTKVIHNNDNTLRIAKLSKAERVEFGDYKKVIGYVGSLWERGAGLDTLIKAFYKVRQEIPNSLLVLVGDGPGKRKLISLTRNLGLKDNTIFTGYKENPFPYIKAFDLLVRPVFHEGSSNIILEALYCETPVIAARVGGNPEILKYEELLFDPRNANELATKILNSFQSDKAYCQIKTLCKERKIVFTFDWGEKMTEAIKSLVDSQSERQKEDFH